MHATCILVTWVFNCNPTPLVFLLSASLFCSLSCFPNDPHTSIYSCPPCIALVHNSLLHHIVACTLAWNWVLHQSRCCWVSPLCVPSFLFCVDKVLLGVLVFHLILHHLKGIVLIINKLKLITMVAGKRFLCTAFVHYVFVFVRAQHSHLPTFHWKVNLLLGK